MCPVNDFHCYYDALKNLFENEPLAEQLAINACHHAEEVFSKDKIINQNLSFYKSLIGHE